MESGKLIYNAEIDRLDMLFKDGDLLGGFHCGDCIDVKLKDKWISTRIEYDNGWYLCGLFQSGKIPTGLNIRRK
jgi:hypothetical protein